MTDFRLLMTIGVFVSAAGLAGCAGGGRGHPLSASATRPSTAAPVAEASSGDILKKLHGGIIGQKIGSELSPAGRQLALEAEYRALEEAPGGKAVTWQSPDGTASGSVVAAPPYQVGSQNCRQYTHKVTINGAEQDARGAACRNPDGSWTPLS